MSLENEKDKTLKLEKENSFLNNSCEEYKHLLNVLKSSHDELKLIHEKLLVSHDLVLAHNVKILDYQLISYILHKSSLEMSLHFSISMF